MTSNTIYYRFLSEKKKYTINFETNEISIADIKKEIKTKRNIDKVPENFELLIFNENSDEIRDDNIKINPLQMLIIKRIPHYKLNANFMETITDPSEISSTRFVDLNFLNQKRERAKISPYDPIEKILPKINFEFLAKKLSCANCMDTDSKLFILSCCGESICENCKNSKFAVNEICGFCEEKISSTMENNRIEEFKERIITINVKKQKENDEALNEINNTMLMQANKNAELTNENKFADKQKNFGLDSHQGGLNFQSNSNTFNNINYPNSNYGNMNRIQGI